MYFFMLSFCVLWVFGDCISNDSRWHLLSLFPKCWAGPADAAAAQPGVNWWLMEWGYLIRLPKNTYKYILLYPAHMFLTVGMTLGIRVPVVGPLKDINFQKHSGAPLAVLVYIYNNNHNHNHNNHNHICIRFRDLSSLSKTMGDASCESWDSIRWSCGVGHSDCNLVDLDPVRPGDPTAAGLVGQAFNSSPELLPENHIYDM
jgi:hypothetical protein